MINSYLYKSLTDRNSISAILAYLESAKADFKLTVSNYTTVIDLPGYTQKFMKSFKSKRCFIGFKKVNEDVRRFHTPRVNENALQYFDHNIRNGFHINKGMLIDVKSAYATVLLNSEYITSETYEYVQSLPKSDRLACIGMLASIKYKFNYENGEAKTCNIVESKTKNFFLYCVREVHKIMALCKEECRNSYVLTWVDGIYISYNEGVAGHIVKILFASGFNCSVSVYHNLSVSIGEKKIKVSMDHEGKRKNLNIPHQHNMRSVELYGKIFKQSKDVNINYIRE